MPPIRSDSRCRPRKILFVITDLDVGGAERCCAELAIGLDRSRWSPEVVCLSPPGSMADRLVTAGVPVHALGVRSYWELPNAVARLTRLMNRIRPALVHTFLFHANVVGRLAAWIACGGPVLASVRVAERRYRHHLILENLTCRLSQRVICVSRAAAQFTRRRSHVPSARLVIIPNGINADAVRLANPVDRASLGITEDSALAVYVGRLDPQKGVDVLLDAMRCAVRLVPELHLVLAGIGPHENQLIGLARSLGVERNVHFLGWRDDVPALLRTADFLVLSSRWEGMPNVVLEAMAAGRPVVATRTEGTTDLVRHGETGVLVSIDDSASLATALVEIARNRDQRSHWGRRGEELVRREFSLSRMLTRYEALYELSLGQSSSRIRV